MEALAFLYLIGVAVGMVFLGLLVWAPLKLYAIHRELVKMNAETQRQTTLLAAIAHVEVERPLPPLEPEPVGHRGSFFSDDSAR